jgi:hypothetical protein
VSAGEKTVGTLGSAREAVGGLLRTLDASRRRVASAQRRQSRNAPGQAGLGALCLAGQNEGGGMTLLPSSSRRPQALPVAGWIHHVAYHDEEWGVPNTRPRALREALARHPDRSVWITILRKRDNFSPRLRQLRAGEDPPYSEAGWKLMQNAGIVRNRMKIEGTILSARLARGDGKGPLRGCCGLVTASRR